MRKLMRVLAIFILGLLLGSSGMNFVLGKQIDQLHQTRDHLVNEIHDKNLMIEELESSVKNLEGKKLKVKSISITVELEEEDEFVQLEIEKACKDMLLHLIGREVGDLDPPTIPAIINKRKVLVEDTEYLLEVVNTLIAEEVVMLIKAEIYLPPN